MMILKVFLLVASLGLIGGSITVVDGLNLKQFSQKVGLNKLFFTRTSKAYVEEFNQIDSYLVRHLPHNENVQANLELAQKWLNQLTTEGRWSQRRLTRALRNFVALSQMDGDNLCAKANVDTLKINNDSTLNSIKRLKEQGTSNAKRTEKVLYNFAVRHLNECPQELQSKYDLAKRKVPVTITQKVASLIEPLIVWHLDNDRFESINQDKSKGGSSASFIDKYPAQVASFVVKSMSPIGRGPVDELKIIFNSLDQISQDDPQNYYLHNDNPYVGDATDYKVKTLFRKHLLSVCRQYRKSLEDIFEPLRFDLQFIDGLHSVADNDGHLEFARAMALYAGCENLRANRRLIQRNLIRFTDERKTIKAVMD